MSRAAPWLDRVAQLRYLVAMKTASIPSVPVEPEFLAQVESVLASVERRRIQAEFIARGLRSRGEAKRTGDYVDADEVVAGLQRNLNAAHARLSKPLKTRK